MISRDQEIHVPTFNIENEFDDIVNGGAISFR